MKTTHTPGPWHSFRQGTKHFISQACDEQFRFATAIVYEQTYHPYGIAATRAKAEANARLIAAAPDLLEALREIANDWPYETPALPADHVRKIARAAIAKAEGKP